MKWAYLAAMVLSNASSEILQSHEMKRHGEVSDFRPDRIPRLLGGILSRWKIILSIFLLALSFFLFLELLKIAELSFVVPASAASIILETVLAWLILRENVDRRRWLGTALVAAGVVLLSW
jgi:drug/metabolite transporter (DMT)-like permease